jgi:tRNA modification GTPase
MGFDRAIVSALPGTTRDTLEEVVMLKGWPLRLVDTAGIRESSELIELEGMKRTQRELEQADLILEIYDASAPVPDVFSQHDRALLRVLNKTDLGEHPSWSGVAAVRLSCQSGFGMNDLEDAVDACLRENFGGSDAANPIAINARHQDCIRRSVDYLNAAEVAFRSGLAPEFVAEELRAALNAAGEIVGRSDTEDLLGRIFSTFCIGK